MEIVILGNGLKMENKCMEKGHINEEMGIFIKVNFIKEKYMVEGRK